MIKPKGYDHIGRILSFFLQLFPCKGEVDDADGEIDENGYCCAESESGEELARKARGYFMDRSPQKQHKGSDSQAPIKAIFKTYDTKEVKCLAAVIP